MGMVFMVMLIIIVCLHITILVYNDSKHIESGKTNFKKLGVFCVGFSRLRKTGKYGEYKIDSPIRGEGGIYFGPRWGKESLFHGTLHASASKSTQGRMRFGCAQQWITPPRTAVSLGRMDEIVGVAEGHQEAAEHDPEDPTRHRRRRGPTINPGKKKTGGEIISIRTRRKIRKVKTTREKKGKIKRKFSEKMALFRNALCHNSLRTRSQNLNRRLLQIEIFNPL